MGKSNYRKNYRVKAPLGYIEFNSEGIEELLKSEEIQNVVNSAAEAIAEAAGEGYEVGRAEDKILDTRAIATVYAATDAAKKDTLENNTLLKAAGSFNGCKVTDE